MPIYKPKDGDILEDSYWGENRIVVITEEGTAYLQYEQGRRVIWTFEHISDLVEVFGYRVVGNVFDS
jgi:hypothetical protein